MVMELHEDDANEVCMQQQPYLRGHASDRADA